MQKKVKFLIICLTVCIFLGGNCVARGSYISIFYQGVPLSLSCSPVIENGNTMVPFRSIFEALGLTVAYDSSTQTVSGKNNEVEISFVIGEDKAVVNGVEKPLSNPTFLYNGTTMVPVRFIAESMGYRVTWDQTNHRVIIGDTAVAGDIDLESTDAMANVYLLYTVDGTGDYAGYKKLQGYPNEDEFSVYYEGTCNSFYATSEDIRGLDPSEVFYWSYNGITHRNTRQELYSFFSDTSYFSSHFAIDGTLSSDWFKSTFGDVYFDWMQTIAFSDDAANLVDKYLMIQSGVQNNGPTLKPDSVISYTGSEWMSEKDLYSCDIYYSHGIKWEDDIIENPGFYEFACNARGALVYGTPSFDRSTMSSDFEKEIDGITIKCQDGVLYFKTAELKTLGIIS